MLNNKSRKIVLNLAVSLDGFIEGINGETDWCIMDEDMNFIKFLSSIDTILYGRKSYEFRMHRIWHIGVLCYAENRKLHVFCNSAWSDECNS